MRLLPRNAEIGEMFGAEQPIEFLAVEQAGFDYEIGDATPGNQRLLGDPSGRGLSDVGVERGDEADGVFDSGAQQFSVSRDAEYAPVRQNAASRTEVSHSFGQ